MTDGTGVCEAVHRLGILQLRLQRDDLGMESRLEQEGMYRRNLELLWRYDAPEVRVFINWFKDYKQHHGGYDVDAAGNL